MILLIILLMLPRCVVALWQFANAELCVLTIFKAAAAAASLQQAPPIIYYYII